MFCFVILELEDCYSVSTFELVCRPFARQPSPSFGYDERNAEGTTTVGQQDGCCRVQVSSAYLFTLLYVREITSTLPFHLVVMELIDVGYFVLSASLLRC